MPGLPRPAGCMKHVIIIADGAADHPLDELGGKTPFEAARKPHTDRLSKEGTQGTVTTTPAGMPCGSDVCAMSLLGYDPVRYHTGRAPLEAAALGIALDANDWIFRVNLVTVSDGQMQDHSGGQVPSDQGRQLLTDFAAVADLPDMTLHPGVSYRNIMVDRSGQRQWSDLRTTPPHDIPGERIDQYLPTGSPHDDLLLEMIDKSQSYFADHPINERRRADGQFPVTHLWPWGQGTRSNMESFEQRFGKRGAMITAVDLLAGIAAFIGWDRLDVPGQSSYHDTDYAAAGRHAIDALDRYDLVCVHVESPDEASHAADQATKVAAIERIDTHIVGPLHEALTHRGPDHRVLYLPDHYTSVASRKHDPTPVPFAMCGKNVATGHSDPFSEQNACRSDLHLDQGHELMDLFLTS